ncbi:MAG TPA: type II CAAX endopeptidase family protein [Longimicrobiales bacterium]|nr:type II CAAX endopeptidase family protein [Longimicrobiales bacterium]
MIIRIAAAMLTPIIFNMLAMVVLAALPPAAGLVWVLFLGGAFYAWAVRPGRRRSHRLARLRLRAPDGAPRLVLLSCAASLLLLFGVGSFIALIAPEIDPGDVPVWYEMLQPYQETWVGWAALATLIALVIPMVEEFSFRGHIQRLIERRHGVPAAIVTASILFMLLHVGGPNWSILAISLTVGITCGLAVHVFRSIWPAVLTHAAWNGTMIAAEALGSNLATQPAPGTAATIISGMGLVGAGVLVWRYVLRREHGSGRESACEGARATAEPGAADRAPDPTIS